MLLPENSFLLSVEWNIEAEYFRVECLRRDQWNNYHNSD